VETSRWTTSASSTVRFDDSLSFCTAILFFILLVVGLLVYLLYAVRALMDTQEVIFDAAVNSEEIYKEIEMNQEAIMNAYSRQN